MKKEKLLVMRFSSMGDVAMLSSVIKEVLNQNQNVFIDFLSRENFEPFFNKSENFNFIKINLDNYKGILGIFRLYKLLKKNNYTAIIDAHNVLRTILLGAFFRLNGVKISILDKGRREKKDLTSKENKKLHQLKHTTERYADIFRKININISLSNKLEKTIRKIDIETLNNGKKNIGIAPFAKHKSKEYPVEKMKYIINILSKYYNIFLFGGGQKEIEVLEEIKKENQNISFYKDIGLKKEMDLISNMDLMITMDSANMHIASLVGTKVLSIWGGTHHFAGFLGYGQNNELSIIDKKLACRPCSIFGNIECFIEKKYDCLDIDEDMIIKKVKFLSQRNI